MNIVRCCYHSLILHFGTSRFWRNFQWQEVNHLYPLQICTQGQRFYYWQLAVSKWKTDELVRWPSCQHVATRIPGGAELLPAATGGISISTGSASAPGRYSFPACLTQGWWWPNQDREPSHPHNGLVKSSQFLLQPGEEARQREQRQCAGFFGLLLPYLPFDSLFPRQPANRWLQFLLPAAESHMRCSTFVCATHLSPAWPWLEQSRKYPSHKLWLTTVRKRSTWYHTNWKLLS